MPPLVSIILPTYNREKTIVRAMESVLRQTYSNVELIVVNDGSCDQTEERIRKIEEKDPRVTVIQKENTGVSDSRNQGLKRVQGEYVMFLDSDDEYQPTMVEKMVEVAQENTWPICYYQNVTVRGNVVSCDRCNLSNASTFEQKIQALHQAGLFSTIWNKLYHFDLIRDHHLQFDTSVSFGEDFMFNIEYCRYIEQVVLVLEELYVNYNSLEGLARTIRPNKFELIKKNYWCAKRMYEDCGYSLDYLYSILLRDTRHCINDLYYRFSHSKEIKQEIRCYLDDPDVEDALTKKSICSWYEQLLVKKAIVRLYWLHLLHYWHQRMRG